MIRAAGTLQIASAHSGVFYHVHPFCQKDKILKIHSLGRPQAYGPHQIQPHIYLRKSLLCRFSLTIT